jgi:RimJ/RimL family protein N-acetyltransferase
VLVQGSDVLAWAELTSETDYGRATALGNLQHGKLIAAVIFNEWNGSNLHMHVVSDGSRRWLSRTYLKAIFTYAFDQLGAKRVTAPVFSSNTRARVLVEKLGFQQEFVMPDGATDGDLILYVMRPSFCRWR